MQLHSVTAAALLNSVDLCAGFIMSGLSHPDMLDTTGWGTYYSSKGVHKERPPLDSLNAQVCANASVPPALSVVKAIVAR